MGHKFGEQYDDVLGAWLKDRHFQKHGIQIKNMDKCIESLCDIELKALINFCKTAKSEFLDIPIYHVRDLHDVSVGVADDHAAADDDQKPLKPPSDTKSFKMAAVNKRGMAQPRKKK